jgi:hypothetical protein
MLISADDLVPIDAVDADLVAAGARARHTVVIDVAGLVCAMHFDRVDVAANVAARYADLRVATRPPQRHAFAIHDGTRGWLFWSEGTPVLRWPHGELPPHVVAFLADAVALTAFLRERNDGIVSLHAASVGLPDGIVAIIGDSHAGKTTTAIACARAGMTLYSDERCLIDRVSFVHAFPRAINLRAGGIRLLARDRLPGADPIGARLRAHGVSDWDDVRVADLGAAGGPLVPRPLCAVVLLDGSAPTASLERVPASRAVRAAARWAQGAGAGMELLARLYAIFARVPCYALRLGTPCDSARLIRRLVPDRADVRVHTA